MNKQELYKKISSLTYISKTDIELVLNTLTNVIEEEVMVNGNEVNFRPLGKFYPCDVKSRTIKAGSSGLTNKDCFIPSIRRLKMKSSIVQKEEVL